MNIDTLFKSIVLNKIIRLNIFNQIKCIHRYLQIKRYNWIRLINNNDNILLDYNYVKIFIDNYTLIEKNQSLINIINTFEKACTQGRLEILQYLVNEKKLFQKYPTYFSNIIDLIKRNNRLDIYQFILNEIYLIRTSSEYLLDISELFTYAPMHNNLEMVQWLSDKLGSSRYPEFTPHPLVTAASVGNREILQWLLDNRENIELKSNYHLILEKSILYGHLDIAKWIYSKYNHLSLNSLNFNLDFIPNDIQSDHVIECLDWALEHNIHFYCTSYAMNSASNRGYFQLVKWIHHSFSSSRVKLNSSLICTKEAMDFAGSHSLEMVKWFYENQSEGYSGECMINAAISGHLDIIQFLHKIGANHSRYFQWAQESNLMNSSIEHFFRNKQDNKLLTKSNYSYHEVSKWIFFNILKSSNEALAHAMLSCCSIGDLELFRYFEEIALKTVFVGNKAIGFKSSIYLSISLDLKGIISGCIQIACVRGHLEIVRYINENEHQYPNGLFSKCEMNLAIFGKNFDIVQYLHLNRTELCSRNVLYQKSFFNLDIIQYLLSNNLIDLDLEYFKILLGETRNNSDVLEWLNGCNIESI